MGIFRKCFWIKTGQPVEPSQTITVDHVTDKFEIVVKSLEGVTIEDIRKLIQSKHELVKSVHIDSKVFVK